MVQRQPPFPVWVDLQERFGIHSNPGVLLAWRRAPRTGESGWECLVIYAAPNVRHEKDAFNVHQAWLSASSVRPMDAERPKQVPPWAKAANGEPQS